MKLMKVNADVSMDFINDKMLKLDERIIYAQRLIYNDMENDRLVSYNKANYYKKNC